MRILGISGSLRAASSNTLVVQAAALLAPDGVSMDIYRGLGDLPHFNADFDDACAPPPVVALRRAVGDADGVLICSPEYAHGIAGSLKNALDWLVGSIEFPGKPVAVINAAQRAHHADAQLREVLRTMSAHLVESASVTLPPLTGLSDAAMIAADAAVRPILFEALRRFVEDIARVPRST